MPPRALERVLGYVDADQADAVAPAELHQSATGQVGIIGDDGTATPTIVIEVRVLLDTTTGAVSVGNHTIAQPTRVAQGARH